MIAYNEVVNGEGRRLFHMSGAAFDVGKNNGVDAYKKHLAGNFTQEDFYVSAIKGMALRLNDLEKVMMILFNPFDLKKGKHIIVANAYAHSPRVAQGMLSEFSEVTKFEVVKEDLSDDVLGLYKSFGMKELETAKRYGRLA